MRSALKGPAYRLSAIYWRLRTRGRIRGRAFRIRRPRELVLAGRLTIGDGTCIDAGASIVVRTGCRIGREAYLGRDLVLVAFADVELGDRVLLGERVSIHTEDHGPPDDRYDYATAPIAVGDDAWLCAGVVLTAGVTVGARATVGANAVVTRDVPADALAVGVPAVVRR